MSIENKKNEGIATAVIKGYSSDKNGNIFNSMGNKLSIYPYKGHYYFTVRLIDSYTAGIAVHRFIAYEKFGDKVFKKGVIVKHKDLDLLNNKHDNIILGTDSERNTSCKSAESRLNAAKIASSHIKKHNHDEIIKMHNDGMSYNKIMDVTGIKSKGTISFIIKQSTSSVVNESK